MIVVQGQACSGNDGSKAWRV